MDGTCDTCMHAIWRRTSNGRLHPSGGGRCGVPWLPAPLPKAFYWVGAEPRPAGGYIDRYRNNIKECPCWQPKQS